MKSSRSAILWSVLALCAFAVLGAMTLLTRNIRASRIEHALAEARADLEEHTRLALWRIDAAGSDILLRENQRPPTDYDTSSSQPSAPFGSTPAVKLHFQVGNGLLTSPGAGESPEKTAALRELLSSNGDIRALLERAANRPQVIWQAPGRDDVRLQKKVAQTRKDNAAPVRASADYQTETNRVEKAQRSKLFANQDASVTSRNNYIPQQTIAPAPADLAEPAAPAPPEIREITGMRPTWIGSELFLIRKLSFTAAGAPVIQGVWLDAAALKSHLLAEVFDLLPDASLEPLPVPVDNPLALVSFPFLLHRGEPAAIPPLPWSRPLVIGWAAVIGALLAVAALVQGILRLSERRASFVSAVTHELRTPLTTFRLYSEMLEGGVVREEKRGQYLRVLTTEADRLSHLVENVLAFSRIERGNARTRFRTVPVGELLDSFRERLETRLASAGLALVMPAADHTRVRADTNAVEHILFNLIDNAAKYAADSDPPVVEISTRPAGKHIAITVRDHGPGIPPAERTRIFRAFHKSAREAAESKPGVGLGLALSRRLAKAQHGDLACKPGETGAAFELTLPAEPR